MTFRPFVPTHKILGGVFLAPVGDEVMLDGKAVADGPAYTHAEYAGFTPPRFEVIDGAWHFDHVRCTGLVVEPLTDQTTPETVSRIRLPESPVWQASHEYPDTARLRADGSVVVHSFLLGSRGYRHLSQFCRAWRTMVSFAVTAAMTRVPGIARVAMPDEILVRHTGEAYALYPGAADRKFASLLAACQVLSLDPAALYRGTVCATEDLASFQLPDGAAFESAHRLQAVMALRGLSDTVVPTDHALPEHVTPPPGRLDADKIGTLAASMQTQGWKGSPVLVERPPHGSLLAWTGRHRILAARRAGLTHVPLVMVDLMLRELVQR